MQPLTFTTYGSSNVAVKFEPNITSAYKFKVTDISFHLSNAAKPNGTVATAANTLKITRHSQVHQRNNVLIRAIPMSGVGDFLYQPTKSIKMTGKDSLGVVWTNDAASFKTWSLQIDYEA